MKKRRNAQDGLQRFLDAIDILEPKLGPILFQLPPNWELGWDRLAAFLSVFPRQRQAVFEFHNPSWNTPQVYDLLARYNAGNCIFDLAGHLSP